MVTEDNSSNLLFYLGQTRSGVWLVRDRTGSHVGIFRTRDDAMRYIRDDVSDDQRPHRFVDLGQCTLETFIAA